MFDFLQVTGARAVAVGLGLALLPACSPAEPETLVEHWEARDFVVQSGAVTDFYVEDCELLERCFGNSATTPYQLFNLPGPAGEPSAIPERTVGEIPRVPDQMAASYYLEAKEAIVVVGPTAPSARYFGFTPYVYTRVAQNDERLPIFASVADTLNHTNVRTASGQPFASQTAIIYTSDADTMRQAREALVADGLAAEAINEVVLSREKVRFGIGGNADTLLLLGRLALPEDQAAADAYLSDSPLKVYRLTPPEQGPALQAPERATRGDGTDETGLVSLVDDLEAAIMDSIGKAKHTNINVSSSQLVSNIIDAEKCLANVTECRGDNRDTTYAVGPVSVPLNGDTLTLGPNESFFVYGVNHEASGKAEYSNVGIYTAKKRIGVVALSSPDMVGSAETFMADEPDASKLFAYEVRRDCAERSFCLTLPTSFPGVPLDESLFFIFRAYINPGLSVSAGHREVLAERVLHVQWGETK